MPVSRRALIGSAASLPLLGTAAGRAQGSKQLRIGILTDMSGPYQDLAGPTAIRAAEQAIEDFGVAGKGFSVEVLQADHQNKADVAVGVARQWYDSGVDAIFELANSAVALAVAGVTKDKNKLCFPSGAATSDLTGAQCNANTVHWAYDTYMLAKSTGGALVKAGGDTWYFITADYAFGHALERDTTGFVQSAGGKVVGSVAYPFPGTTDFSSFLLQAQSSGAKILGMANAGNDTINTIKQANEFGLKMTLAGLLLFISDVHSLGLATAKGIQLTSSFYWDMNDRTRKFSERFKPKAPDRRATMVQAGVYSSVLHYLKVASAMGIEQAKKDGRATMEQIKATPTDDDCFGPGKIRVDGRKLCPAYLWKVKSPAESKGPWDYYKPIATTPADDAFRPLGQGGCKLANT